MAGKLPDGDGKRHPIGFRTTRDLKDRIEAAAAKSGRSVAQEVEARINHTFDLEEHEDRLKQGPIAAKIDKDTENMVDLMKTVAGAIMLYADANWRTDVYARAAIQSGFASVLTAHFDRLALDLEPTEVDVDRLRQSIDVGQLMGRVLSASRYDPKVVSWITDMAARARASGAPMVDDEERNSVRQNAAIRELIGKDAA